MSACHGTTTAQVRSPARAAVPSRVPTEGTGTILLVGNPNAGKSTLFNALTGARQRQTNAPGTTVELQVGRWLTTHAAMTVVDLPGTYSLIARSPDEQVVADAVRDGAPEDVVVVVLDATGMARSLYLLAQVALSGRAVVVVVSMLDVAREHGAAVDVDAVGEALGVPVIGLDPRRGDPAGHLARAVLEHDGRGVRGLSGLPSPWSRACDHSGEATAVDVEARLAAAEPLFGWVEDTVLRVRPPVASRVTRTDLADRLLLNPWLGVPVFLAVLWSLFQLTTGVAAPILRLVEEWVNVPVASAVRTAVGGWAGPWWEGLLIDGVLAGVGTVLTFLPLLALVYTALALLEDSGYMARAAFLADRLMRTMGLDGRAMLPLIIGFGCNVPALAATRTLPDARQRLLTGLLVPWTSCAARLTVYILIAGAFFGDRAGTVIFALYCLSVALVVGGGLVLRRSALRDVSAGPLMLVLPAYQRPHLRSILRSVSGRVAAFATGAGRIIVATLTVVWLLMSVPMEPGHSPAQVPVEASAYGRMAEAVAPVMAPAGLDDWHVAAALATGFVAKEVVVGSLAQSYTVAEDATTGGFGGLPEAMRTGFDESSGGHGGAAALAFMVFVLAYTPCVAALAEQRRLFGSRWAFGAVVVQLVVAWALAVVVFQIGRLL